MTPLRWKIAVGYALFLAITIFLWKDLISGWALLMSFLAPVTAFFAALIALKFSVVIASLGAFLLIFLSSAVSTLIAVSKMGIIKGLFLPWLLAGLQWLHKKNDFLQRWVSTIYTRGKHLAETVFSWWQSKHIIDKILLLGFLGPLILVVAFAVLIKRFVYIFISKKAAEQIVQRTTKALVGHFHRVPVLGKVPEKLKNRARSIRDERDRKLARMDEVHINKDNPVTGASDQPDSGKKDRVDEQTG